MRILTPLEARVLGVLVEKQATVPDTYPLSLNALVAGCNQKTARQPVIESTEADVLIAVDGLKALSLVFEGSGARVVRYEHNMGRVLGVPSQAVALLTALMLRGPQTSAELRLNCERLASFCRHFVSRRLPGRTGGERPTVGREAVASPWRSRAALGPPPVRRGG